MGEKLSIVVQFIRAIFICCALTIFLFSPHVSEASDYLSTGDVVGISLGSGTLAGIGNFVKNSRTKSGFSSWTKPLPGERKIMNFLGGKYYPGKSNFLDNGFGSVVTPIIAVPIITGINMKWPRNKKGKDISQDLFLLSTGLLATNGITELFKGIFRRQRPLVSLYPNNEVDKYKLNSAFNTQSFISGHSSIAFYTVTYMNLRLRTAMRQNLSAEDYKNWSWLSPTVLYGWATFVGWSRLHAYKHYPSDVLIGALIGSLLAELFYSLNDKISRNHDSSINKMIYFKININI